MPYAVEHRGKLVDVPFDVLPQSSITGRFPNDVVLKMDESRFHVSFGRHAVWVQGWHHNHLAMGEGRGRDWGQTHDRRLRMWRGLRQGSRHHPF